MSLSKSCYNIVYHGKGFVQHTPKPVIKIVGKMIPYVPLRDEHFGKWMMYGWNDKPELYPLAGCFVLLSFMIGYTVVWTCMKNDIWLARWNRSPPWHWSRNKDTFEKKQRIIERYHWPRIADLDKLQEEMAIAGENRQARIKQLGLKRPAY